MISYPNAKINLGLNILGKREDGFHDIESVFYPVPWNDILEIVPEMAGNGQVSFTSSGLEIPSNGGENLCEQVYHLLNAEFDLPSVKIHLHKQIPIGAGLGGGSADAAQTALMLNDMFSLGLSIVQLENLVAQVGSDCPFFIQNLPAYVTGRGEVLEQFDLDLSHTWMVLINPNIHIGTAEAYAGISPQLPEYSLKKELMKAVSGWKNRVKNDFEQSVFRNYPSIKELKEAFYENGADYAAMTGSGSTTFGLFSSDPKSMSFPKGFLTKIIRL